MKFATTNQTLINSIASDGAWAVIENIEAGLTLEEAINAQVAGAMEDSYDEDSYDAPYNPEQLREAYIIAVKEEIAENEGK